MKSKFLIKIFISLILTLFLLLLSIIIKLLSILNKIYLLNEFNQIIIKLFHLAHEGKTKKPIISKDYKIMNYSINKKNGICLCTIGKNENLYIREFIEYYRLLGFAKIYIFDNNDLNGETFEDIIKDYIKMKFVELIDVRGLISIQGQITNYCYKKFQKLYDWIAIFDIDEYLFIKNESKILFFIFIIILKINNIRKS